MTPQMELIADPPSTSCRTTYACASVQTELTFEPDCFVTLDSHPVEVVEVESEEEPVSSSDPLWIPAEEEQLEEEMPETISEENAATELKVIVFWKQLLLLLQCCQICKASTHVYERV